MELAWRKILNKKVMPDKKTEQDAEQFVYDFYYHNIRESDMVNCQKNMMALRCDVLKS